MRSAVLLGGQMVVNALAGYAFQKVFAYYYGASVEKSIFDIAFSVPTMLVYLSGIGQAYAVVVSLFSRLRDESPSELNAVFSTLTNLSFVALLAIVLITALLSDPISAALAPGFTEAQRQETQFQILWLLPLAVVFGLSSHLSAVALAWRVPIGQEVVLLIARAAVIVAMIVRGEAMPLDDVALILVISTVVALSLQWLMLKRVTGLKYEATLDLRNQLVRQAIRQLSGLLIVSIVAQFAAAYCRRMGTIAGPTVVALIGFAYSLMDAVASIVGKTLSFQIGQPLATRMRNRGAEHALPNVGRSLTIALVLGLGCGAAMFVLDEWIVALLFGGGAFDDTAIAETTHYLGILALGLPGAIVVWVCLYPLLEVTRHLAAVTYVVGYSTQVAWIALTFDSLSGSAIAWSYCACFWSQAALAWFMLVQFSGRVRK